jgi:hypothetical protein
MVRTQFLIHVNLIDIGDIITSSFMYIFISILGNCIYNYFILL